MQLPRKLARLELRFDVEAGGAQPLRKRQRVIEKGAELLGIEPSACVVFEDAIAGIEAAKAGGMKVVGIGHAETLSGADLVVAGLHEMNIEILEKIKTL